jgi:hypothetical protein
MTLNEQSPSQSQSQANELKEINNIVRINIFFRYGFFIIIANVLVYGLLRVLST